MIIRLNPWYHLDEDFNSVSRLRRDFDKLFSSVLGRDRDFISTSYPTIDVFDTGESIGVYSELPGMNKEDIKIVVNNDVLTVSGKRELPETPENVRWLRHERFHGEFSRSFKLPYDIEADNVKAEFKEGILQVSLPKKEELKPKEISVK
jgi:HSP20 family protein